MEEHTPSDYVGNITKDLISGQWQLHLHDVRHNRSMGITGDNPGILKEAYDWLVAEETGGKPPAAPQPVKAGLKLPLRIGDDEREACRLKLETHFEKGRLTLDEFNDRVGKALTARIQADLDVLLEDLPATPKAREFQFPIDNEQLERARQLAVKGDAVQKQLTADAMRKRRKRFNWGMAYAFAVIIMIYGAIACVIYMALTLKH